jgi:MFS family permease
LRFFIGRVPLSLTTIAVAGLLIGAFYGLAPLYGTRMGLSTEQVGLFMGFSILAGLLVQWPLGWLSDRYDRVQLIRGCAALLVLAALPLALLTEATLALLFAVGFLVCALQFSLYPLAVALANDHVEGERRVSLTAMLLVTFGVGASVGPLLAGVLMRFLGANMLYAFVCACAMILVVRVRPERVTHLHQVEDAPLHHIPMPDSTTSSPLTAALDPRVDEQVVHEQMHDSEQPADDKAEARGAEVETRP